MRLILASTSPRRHELLSLLGIPFEIAQPSFLEQVTHDTDPVQQAKLFAEQKARSCGSRLPGRLVLGSDTLISCSGRVLGKPADLIDAETMLRNLRGRKHTVHTAVALYDYDSDRMDVSVEGVDVWMRSFTEDDLKDYLRSSESLGKAGAYSIQGRGGDLIERIEGDFPAVVGLPLRLVALMLDHRGIEVPVDVDALYGSRPYPNWDRFG